MSNNRQSASGHSRYHLLKIAHEHFGCPPAVLNNDQLLEAERIVSRQLQIEEAVLYSPEATGVVIPPGHIDDAWAQISGRYDDPEALRQALSDSALDEARIRPLLARELKVEAVLDRVCKDLTEIGDVEVSLYYFNHLEQFVRPASRQARHILITINPEFPENTREAALARVESIAKRLHNKPGRFAEQALKHSECPTSLQGGQLGNVRPGVLYPELEACLFALEVGRISAPVESPLGFHLLFCESLEPSMCASLDVVLPHLREKLRGRQRKAHQRQWLKQLLQHHSTMESRSHG
jgi:peptidyl-prolyl cis-trans isomerase C